MIKLIINLNREGESLFHLRSQRITLGSADDCDACIDISDVSPHHARIEKRENSWCITDLHSAQGTYVDNENITTADISPGTLFLLGDIPCLFDVIEDDTGESAKEEGAEFAAVVPTTNYNAQPATTGGHQCTQCGNFVPAQSRFCPVCGAEQSSHAVSPFVTPVETAAAPGAGLMPLIAFITSILGPLLLGIGWLVGIILGLVAARVIRRRGGHRADLKKAYAAVYIGFAWAAIIAAAISWWIFAGATSLNIKHNEAIAAQLMNDIGCAQKYHHIALLHDEDNDSIPSYATLDQLAETAYRSRLAAFSQSHEMNGYRFSMPHVSEDEYICIAEPVRYGITGRRTFALSENGLLHAKADKNASTPAEYLSFPAVSQRPVFSDAAAQIVQDAYAIAENALSAETYEKALRIATHIKNEFPHLAQQQNVTRIMRTAEPFVKELHSLMYYVDATNAVAQGRLLKAINVLTIISSNHPGFSRIAEVESLRVKLEDQYKTQSEKNARNNLTAAAELENKGDFTAARDAYTSLITLYPKTAAAREAKRRIALLSNRAREFNARELLDNADARNIQEEYTDVFSLTERLLNSFADTIVVSQSRTRITQLNASAAARMSADIAHSALASNDMHAAISAFHSAATKDPAYVASFADTYAPLLIAGITNAVNAADFPRALTYLTRFKTLKVKQEQLSARYVNSIYLSRAAQLLESGNISNALELVNMCRFSTDIPPRDALTAGTLYYISKQSEFAAPLLATAVSTSLTRRAALPVYCANLALLAYTNEMITVAHIRNDSELCDLSARSELSFTPVTNTLYEPWREKTIALADTIELSRELLSHSSTDTDLYLEKQRALSDIQSAVRTLQDNLRDTIQLRRDIVESSQAAAENWMLLADTITNNYSINPTTPLGTLAELVIEKAQAYDYAYKSLSKGMNYEMLSMEKLYKYLEDTQRKLKQKQLVRRAQHDIRRFLEDTRGDSYIRNALSRIDDAYKKSIADDQLKQQLQRQ